MALNSINTNIAAYYAQSNIGVATGNTSKSVARLSSGNKIVQAADDVAALSAGTSLRTNVTTLRTALINTSQANSLLQVADGALSQVTEILQRQKAIAVQAGSGTLTSAERSFLNQEFTNLTSEIDRLVDNTNFNGVKLLNGDLFDVTKVSSKDTAAEAALGNLNFTENTANVATSNLIINGVTITVGTNGSTNVARGTSVSETLDNLVNFLNSSTNTQLSQATYKRQGNALVITQRAGGTLGQSFTVENNIQRSTALSDNGLATGNRIATFSGVSSGYAYQQIWGMTAANVTTDITNAGSGGAGYFTAGVLSVLNNSGAATTAAVLVSGDTLQSTVDKINYNSSATGVTARIIGASGYYGIQLETSTQRDITVSGAALGAATDLLETGTTGKVQLRSDSFAAANLRTTSIVGTGVFATGVFTINGTAGSTNNTTTGSGFSASSAQAILNSITTDFGTNVTATLEWDSTSPGSYYLVLSSSNVDTLTVGAGGAAVGTNNIDANTSSQLVDLQGGTNVGLRKGVTTATGTVGDSILTSLSNVRAQETLSFTTLTAAQQLANLNRTQIRFDTGNGNAGQQLNFTLLDTSSASATTFDDNIIKIGATLGDTLDNIVSAINNYVNAGEVDAYAVKQITARREGNNVILEYNDIDDLYARGSTSSVLKMYTTIAQTDATLSSASTVTGTGLDGGLTNQVASFNSGSATGVNASGVINKDFVGTIQGFEAVYGGTPNRVTVNLKVGDITYTATNVNTNVTTDTTVRLLSESGGYLDIFFAANQGNNVTSQADADTLSNRLDQAFSTIKFSQNRNISSYNGSGDIITNATTTGSLTGTSVQLQGSSFTDVKIDDVTVSSPPEGVTSGIIEFKINGNTYRSRDDIGSKLAANGVYQFKNVTNPNEILTFKVGSTAIQFDNSDKAANFETALKNAFGIGQGGESLKFQVGVTTQDTLSLKIDSITTEKLYDGQSLNVLTQESAATAANQLDLAIQKVTSVRANVGALQSRFNFAAANIESSIQNQDAARGVLLDTDIAAESTAYATNQVKLQAGISVLAQANQQLQNLLKLIS